MRPVLQDRFGNVGNCFEACLASILNLELQDVPDLGSNDVYERNLARFLETRGLIYVLIDRPNELEKQMMQHMFAARVVYHVIEGTSPRGGPHACVGKNGLIVHDPHKGGGGLIKVQGWGFVVKRLE